MQKLTKTTITLHWIVAIFIIGLLATGVYMEEFEAYSVYPIHKSFGVIALFFILWRVIYRTMEGWPEPVREYPKHEEILSKVTKYVLIIGTILMPISGMMMSGFGGYGISVFGFEWIAPNFHPENANEVVALHKELAELGAETHEIVGYLMIATVGLHIIGALKHHFMDKDNTLKRMLGK